MDKIVIENLTVQYADGTESLKNINLNIPANQVTVLFGPSGGGKSTLLRTLNRLNDLADVHVQSGHVWLDKIDILDPELNVINLRRKVGMVFSRPALLPLSIYENVAYGLRVAGEKRTFQLNKIVEQALRQAVLWDEVFDRLNDSAFDLSGGQQQRLCIARTVAIKPEVILFDEPCSALDPISTAKIEELIDELKQDYTIVIVTHNMQQAARVSDFTAFMYLGELVEFGATETLFTTPTDKRTQAYITGRFG